MSEELREFARAHQSGDFVVCKEGEVIVDEHWDLPPHPLFAREALEGGRTRQDVASVQKSIVSVLIGIALANGELALEDTATQHLGAGWTGREDVSSESAITVRHLLSMTSGLGDAMEFVAEPGTQWNYNLVAYPTVKRVLTAAVGESLDDITRAWLTEPLGMADTVWAPRRWHDALPAALRGAFFYPDGTPMEALVSTARDLAVFGQAVLAGGVGEQGSLGIDAEYLGSMTAPSQELNPSFGLLWWTAQPGLPAGSFAALGAGDQCCVVVPSEQLVVARTGYPAAGVALAESAFVAELAVRALTATRGTN